MAGALRDQRARHGRDDAAAAALTGVRLGVLGLAGGLLVLTAPGAAPLAVCAGFLSLMMAGLEMIAVHELPGSRAARGLRSVVSLLAPALAATLAWIAIALPRLVLGEGPLAAALALPSILLLLAIEGVSAIALQRVFARMAGRSADDPVSMLLHDKYVELPGVWR